VVDARPGCHQHGVVVAATWERQFLFECGGVLNDIAVATMDDAVVVVAVAVVVVVVVVVVVAFGVVVVVDVDVAVAVSVIVVIVVVVVLLELSASQPGQTTSSG